MTSKQINDLVKKLEPLFIGYTAKENRLVNSNGMELVFRVSWNNRTTVSGLHASRTHSIGCSFEKPLDKIFKDIRRRLMTDYHADFFETKRQKIEQAEAEELDAQKLRAISSVINGEIVRHYGQGTDCVSTENVCVYQSYDGIYKFEIKTNYFDAMKLAKYLNESLKI